MNTSSLRSMRSAPGSTFGRRPALHRRIAVSVRAASSSPSPSFGDKPAYSPILSPSPDGTIVFRPDPNALPSPPAPGYSPALSPTPGGTTGSAYSGPIKTTPSGGSGSGGSGSKGSGGGGSGGGGSGSGSGSGSGGSSTPQPSGDNLALAAKIAAGLAVLGALGWWASSSGLFGAAQTKGQELKKDVKHAAHDAKDKTHAAAEEAKKKAAAAEAKLAEEAKKKAAEVKAAAEEAKKKAAEGAKEAEDKARGIVGDVSHALGSAAHKVADQISGGTEAVSGAAKSGVDRVRNVLTHKDKKKEAIHPGLFYPLLGAAVLAASAAVAVPAGVYLSKKGGSKLGGVKNGGKATGKTVEKAGAPSGKKIEVKDAAPVVPAKVTPGPVVTSGPVIKA